MQQEMTRLQFEAATCKKPKVNFCGPESEDDGDDGFDDTVTISKLQAKLAGNQPGHWSQCNSGHQSSGYQQARA